jgi:hypothetical protein
MRSTCRNFIGEAEGGGSLGTLNCRNGNNIRTVLRETGQRDKD